MRRFLLITIALLLMGTGQAGAFLDPLAETDALQPFPDAPAPEAAAELRIGGNYVPALAVLARPADSSLPVSWPGQAAGGSAGPGGSGGVLPTPAVLPPDIHYTLTSAVTVAVPVAGGAWSLRHARREEVAADGGAVRWLLVPAAERVGETLDVSALDSRYRLEGVRYARQVPIAFGKVAGRAFVAPELLAGAGYYSLAVNGVVSAARTRLGLEQWRSGADVGAGLGLAVHAGAVVEVDGGWRFGVAVENALSSVWWPNVKHSVGVADTDTAFIDADGYASFHATASGFEWAETLVQRLPVEPTLAVAKRWGHTEGRLLVDLYGDRVAGRPEVRWAGGRGVLTISYDSLTAATGLSWRGRRAWVSLMANDLNPRRCTTLALSAGGRLTF